MIHTKVIEDGSSVIITDGQHKGQVGVIKKYDSLLMRYQVSIFQDTVEVPDFQVKEVDLTKPFLTGEEEACL